MVSNYGIQIWSIRQRFQSKILRLIANALRYVTNATLHQDVNISTVQVEIQKFRTKYLSRLQSHPIILASELSHQALGDVLKDYRRLIYFNNYI